MTGRGLGADTASSGQRDTTKLVGLDVPTRFAAVHESGCGPRLPRSSRPVWGRLPRDNRACRGREGNGSIDPLRTAEVEGNSSTSKYSFRRAIWAERGVVSQEYEKPIAKEEVCFTTDRRCEVKDLRTLVHRNKRETAMRRKPVNLLSLGHAREQ